MEVKDAIATRRSIRKYSDACITSDVIEELLKATAQAPSGCNAQPWRFYIVESEKLKDKLKTKKAFFQNWVYTAPLILVCCGDPEAYSSLAGVSYQFQDGTITQSEAELEEFLKGKAYLRTVRDVSIATSFLVLRATEMGLGTCWVGLIREEVIKEELRIPESYCIPFVVCIGYPAQHPSRRARKKWSDLLLHKEQ